MNQHAKRDYVNERLNESPQRKQARKDRNKARRTILKELTAKYGSVKANHMMKGKDVDHKKPIALGGSTARSNLRLRGHKANISDKSTIFKGKKTTRPKNPRKG